jgi:hypothetical protein
MTEPLVVRIADLSAAIVRALEAAEQLLGPEVSLDGDHYWHMPVEAAFNLTREPREFTVGQLSDDLHDALIDDHERVPQETWHDLTHLIGLLRAVERAGRP